MIPELRRDFLREVGEWRRCVPTLTNSRSGGPLYMATQGVMEGIDGVAEVVAGKRDHFWLKSPSTPGPDLPPLRRRVADDAVGS